MTVLSIRPGERTTSEYKLDSRRETISLIDMTRQLPCLAPGRSRMAQHRRESALAVA